jgi:hypothetical protein
MFVAAAHEELDVFEDAQGTIRVQLYETDLGVDASP